MVKKKLTAKQFLQLNPNQYIMVTYEFGTPIYIAPLENLRIQVTLDENEAELWSALDNSPTKLQYHIATTGYKELKFEKV